MSEPHGIKDFLKAEVKMLRRSKTAGRWNGWRSTDEFVLKHGRNWPINGHELPEDVEIGKLGQCFRNATLLALGFHRNEYIYCEGYALNIIPMAHAWCVDGTTGRVIDPTWGQDTTTDYFGLAFNVMYLQEHLLEHRTYGLIDAWEARWPLLTAKIEDWRHPINDFANKRLRSLSPHGKR
jgi:hypothetical protein